MFPTLDGAVLRSIAAHGGKAFATEVIQSFVRTTENGLVSLYAQLDSQDHAQIRKHVHYLKGGAGSVGACRFAQALEVFDHFDVRVWPVQRAEIETGIAATWRQTRTDLDIWLSQLPGG